MNRLVIKTITEKVMEVANAKSSSQDGIGRISIKMMPITPTAMATSVPRAAPNKERKLAEALAAPLSGDFVTASLMDGDPDFQTDWGGQNAARAPSPGAGTGTPSD
ncbi:hypothetical protein JCM17845_12700 [Iodidimonas gelatinilytica]|uniref:Uncharacterized protein n=1 Tax=Iodidimonas gelatinilytica TaxID=1236966 RepID=A0A5A7MXP5_9PROT|nr:hypothetical protein JCM17845_12700 [Iodidimonas gelatinilytica]